MKNNQLIEVLKELGLSENESKVYFSNLSLGSTTIQKIAQAAELKRTTTYSIIDSLKQKGLINIELRGFKKLFVAENPEKLSSVLESRKNKFQKLLPEFAALYNLKGGESFIKYYEGLESVKGIYESLIRDIRPHEDYMVMANQDQWIALDETYFRDFLDRRSKLPINLRMMFQDTEQGKKWKDTNNHQNTRIKMLPSQTTLSTNLVITPQRVLVHQLVPPIFGIVIENKSIINMHREMYEIIWNSIQK